VDDQNADVLLQQVAKQIGSLSPSVDRNVEQILRAVRDHLRMDVAFVTEVGTEDRIFRHVINDSGRIALQAGDRLPMDAGYCARVLDGHLPELIPDTAGVPAARALPETQAIPIGAHLSVPIVLADGRVYGTFCCFSFEARLELDERDLHMMRAFAQLVACQVQGDLDSLSEHAAKVERISAVLEMRRLRTVYQPIYRLSDYAAVGVECLSRFDTPPVRGPDQWFEEATEIGLGACLELSAMQAALEDLAGISGDFYVSVNVSPKTLVSSRILDHLHGLRPNRLVMEITEHALVLDYLPLQEAIGRLREAGVRFAVDDAGAGYSNMRHILTLQPDIIKMDISLTRDIDADPGRKAMAAAMVGFCRQTGCHVVAEGVETSRELQTLQALGVDHVQGYHLSRPVPREELVQLLRAGDSPN
jgi:EAL domain-containing protein (putative c-di-GMP-specific phosphodiesterase class I)